jgi:hypothetical protein
MCNVQNSVRNSDPWIFHPISFAEIYAELQDLKGQSHEKIAKKRPWDGSIGPN